MGVSECELVSEIDLRYAYHTLQLAKTSQRYCGITPYGSDTFTYQRLRMGSSVSPILWYKFINSVHDEIPDSKHHLAIMHDCLVHSKAYDHLHHLVTSFQALIRNGLKFSPKTC